MSATPNKATTLHLRILNKVLFTWYGWLGILCLLSALIFIPNEFIKWTILQGHMRTFLLGFVGAVIVLTVPSIFEVRYVLKYHPSRAANLKLAAEISAGLGILAFVAQFAQIGSTLDHLSPNDRSKQLKDISADMRSVLKCTQTPPDPQICAQAEKNFLRLEMYIATRSEYDVESVSNELKAQVQHLQTPAKELCAIRYGLDGMSRTNDVVAKILLLMPIVTLVFASFAIAAKIALAWHDKYKPGPQSPPSKITEDGKHSAIAPSIPATAPIPVNPQTGNPTVVAVAVALTAVAAAVIVSEAAQMISELRRSD